MTTPTDGPTDAASRPAGPVRKSREIRVGLVMYGGVSLTTYTNGVAREFHDAVRGRGVYALVKALTDSDFVVDVMSGTSAGGINGVLLGYCLANGYEFGQFEQLWRERGALMDLVVPVGNLETTHSLLDGDYFLGQLEDALKRAKTPRDASRSSSAPLDAEPSVVSELDLFVTATDARGRIYTWFDDAGHAVDVKDHRAVFKLKYRADRYADPGDPPRYTDFGPDDSDALAKLARSTASFPVAFPPSRVADSPVDATLRKWGNLHPTDTIDLLDGGVLDNKPFTYTLDAIFFRHADRDVKRVLFYIEPDPERLAEGDEAWRRLKSHPPVTAFEAMTKGLSGIPAYESIAEDLRMLTRHNEAVTRRRQIHEMLTTADVRACPPLIAKLHRRLRLAMLSERVLHGLLMDRGHDQLFAEPAQREAIARMAQGFWGFFDGDLPFAKLVLRRYDIYFRLRRLFHLLYQPDAGDRAQPWYRALVALVDLHEIVRWGMETVIDACTASLFVENAGPDGSVVRTPDDLWFEAQAVLDHFLAVVRDSVVEARRAVVDSIGRADGARTLGASVKDLREKVKIVIADAATPDFMRRVRAAPAATDGAARHTLAELDLALRGVLRIAFAAGRPASVQALKEAHRTFRCLDALELVEAGHSRLPSRDVIRTVRLSPFDAYERRYGYSRSVPPADKIAGDSLFHFGGFVKRAWRSNDIMWGRIDGSSQLLADFADDGARVAQVLADDRLRQSLADRITAVGGALDPAKLFAQGTWDDITVGAGGPSIASWLSDLLSDLPDVRAEAVARWSDGLKALALAHHRSIVAGSAETVLLDQLAEEMEWGGRAGSRLRRWFRGVGDDASLAVKLMYARQVVRGDLDDMGLRPESAVGSPHPWRVERPDRLDEAVEKQLNVGSQTVGQALPKNTMTRLASRITQAALHAFANSAGDAARRVRSHSLFLWGDRICRTLPVLVSQGVLGTMLRGALIVFVGATAAILAFGESAPSGFRSGAIAATVVLAGLSIFVRVVPRWLFSSALSLLLFGVVWVGMCAVGCPWDAVCAPLRDVPARVLEAVRTGLDRVPPARTAPAAAPPVPGAGAPAAGR